MTQIRCENVTLGYEGLTAISNISFTIEEQDYLCIIGDNGTGKSTLMRAILGLKRINHGEIVLGTGVKRNQIGYLAQQTEVQKEFPSSVWEVVCSGCLNQKRWSPFYSADEKKRATKVMETLGIEPLKKKCYRELSGGQQQRVLLARALCAAEKILFLDEPTTGLDPKMTTEFFTLVERLNQSQGVSIVMVTHDTHCAVKYAKHILHLKEDGYFFGTKNEYLHSDLGKEYIGGHRHD